MFINACPLLPQDRAYAFLVLAHILFYYIQFPYIYKASILVHFKTRTMRMSEIHVLGACMLNSVSFPFFQRRLARQQFNAMPHYPRHCIRAYRLCIKAIAHFTGVLVSLSAGKIRRIPPAISPSPLPADLYHSPLIGGYRSRIVRG